MERTKLVHSSPQGPTRLRFAMPLAAAILLAACVTPPPRTVVVASPPPQRVFVYPANGQTPEQTERDRYECHVWAVEQTGVDPSRANAGYERVVVQPANPPGASTAAGAIGGAIIGSHHCRSLSCGSRRLGRRRDRRDRRFGCGCERSTAGATYSSSSSIKAPPPGGRGPIPIGAPLVRACRGAVIR